MYAQCVVMYGVNIVIYKFDTDEALLPNMSFKTGDVVDNIGGAGGVYTGTATNGSTDGTVEQDYKSPVVAQIYAKSHELIQAGEEYATPSSGTIRFPLVLDQQAYPNAVKSFIDFGGDISVDIVSISTIQGVLYDFEDNQDYQGWFEAMFARAREINNDNASLIDDVTSAANTSAAMASIISANNART